MLVYWVIYQNAVSGQRCSRARPSTTAFSESRVIRPEVIRLPRTGTSGPGMRHE